MQKKEEPTDSGSSTGADRWENDYARRGRVWGGAVHYLPPVAPGGRVLELGCGNGKTCTALLAAGADVTGVDFSQSAVRMCREAIRGFPHGDVIVADARNLPFTAGSFGTVTAFHVMGHLTTEDRHRSAREAARVLRSGGTLYFSGFSREDFRAGTGCETEPQTFCKKNGIATHYFTEEEVRALFYDLVPASCATRRWTLSVRGKKYPRAEIAAVFNKAQ